MYTGNETQAKCSRVNSNTCWAGFGLPARNGFITGIQERLFFFGHRPGNRQGCRGGDLRLVAAALVAIADEAFSG